MFKYKFLVVDGIGYSHLLVLYDPFLQSSLEARNVSVWVVVLDLNPVRTPSLLSVPRDLSVFLSELPGGTVTAATGVVEPLGIASGAAFLVAALFLSSSKSLQRVVRISTVSPRSFFSAASLFNSYLQASLSTLKFSFSNSSGVRASVALLFLVCLILEAVVAVAAIGAAVVLT